MQQIVLCLMIGGLLGFFGCSMLFLNQGRGVVISALIGALGGLLGGQMIAPLFVTGLEVPGDFNAVPVAFAIVAAAMVLGASHLVYRRWKF
jgi:uncharacterized membrane protein YeaQ/YmgE (transglycosylase-associated protein family)